MTEEDIPEPMRNWFGHVFSSGCYTGPDYLAFQDSYARWLRKALKGYRVTVNMGHYEFSAVIIRKGAAGMPDRHVYMSISDVRYFPKSWYSSVLMRTMSHAEDWAGGENTYCAIGYIPKRVEELMSREMSDLRRKEW